jgi:threonine synthase
MRQFCTVCGNAQGNDYRPFCQCGGMVEVEYDLKKAAFRDSPNPYVRYADLLPSESSPDRIPKNTRFTATIHATRLGAHLGMPSLYLKDETALPTRSTKDRMAVVSLAYLWERGVRSFCTSSTGNSSSAYAHAIRAFPGMHLHLFTAEDFVRRVQHADHDQVTHYGLRGASFVDAFNYAGIHAGANGLVSERGFFNPGRREGLKLAFFEASEQIPIPIDWYVQAISSAMGVYGTYKGAKELLALGRIDRLPKLLCVQQDRCAPMVNAYREGAATIQPHHIVPRPRGIAEAILRGDPTRAYPLVRGIVVESGGDFVSVSDDEIRQARRMVEEMEGALPCFSASTAVAGLIKQVRNGSFPVKDTVMINLTGGDRVGEPAPTRVVWMRGEGTGWSAERPGAD